MIFLTVGTQFPFDRLVKAIDSIIGNGLLNEKVFGQIGETIYQPRYFESVKFLDKNEFDDNLRQSTGIIGHAGMGTIQLALDYGKPLLVMPRLKKYHEVLHDHQVEIARKFEALAHLLVAYQEKELFIKTQELKDFVPKKREVQVESVVKRISEFLEQNNGFKFK